MCVGGVTGGWLGFSASVAAAAAVVALGLVGLVVVGLGVGWKGTRKYENPCQPMVKTGSQRDIDDSY